MTEQGKLVRDRIPEIIKASGGEPMTRRLGADERLPALLAKLREETAELEKAHDADRKAEELADVQEVVIAIATDLGLQISDIQRIADAKRAERGSFSAGWWLQSPRPEQDVNSG